jgi:excisionase family DNA binding protein
MASQRSPFDVPQPSAAPRSMIRVTNCSFFSNQAASQLGGWIEAEDCPHQIDGRNLGPRREPLLMSTCAARKRLLFGQEDDYDVNSRYLDVKAAAEYLGRSEGAIRHLVERRQIPFIRQGGRVFFDRLSLDRWMSNGSVQAVQEEGGNV